MARSVRQLLGSVDGAVAPTIALSLFGLIAAGGIAFDYARLASMDTELQNAADQATLAAASQLDGDPGACERAVAAARNLISNQTVMANDSGGLAVQIADPAICDGSGTGINFDADASIRFYQDIGKTVPATDDSNAKFVEVTVDPRQSYYTLTPMVGAFSSGDIEATAFAGLGEAICNTPPVMMCNPSEPDGNTNVNYPFTAVAGDGVRLVVSSPQAPGDFGFLQTGYGTGAQSLAKALGYNNPPANCAAGTGVDTEPGDKEAVRAAFNTRFDLSESGLTCPGGAANCSPSANSRKDLVRGNNCGVAGQQGWQEAASPYLPSSPTVPLPADGSSDPAIMGFPRDMCHAVSVNGACETDGDPSSTGDIIGTGDWDRDAYFRVNYRWMNQATWMSNTSLTATATRYDVYAWEMKNPAIVASANADLQTMANGKTGHKTPICRTGAVTPDETTPDRRRISVAVINCGARGVNGRRYDVGVLKWMDVFLTEPAYARQRTTNGDIYVEVLGETTNASTGSLQIVQKAVPYLIE